jgi:DNA-directed RNA polymerase subunit RPC12/RpoP
MKTCNIIIYHCVTCGRIVHADLDDMPPMCCGHAMVKASEDTVHGRDSDEDWTNDLDPKFDVTDLEDN